MNENQTIDAVENARSSVDSLIRLSTGVVLKGKQANATMLIKVMAQHPRPQPPIYMNNTMGRLVENPDDPDYISRVNAWNSEYGDSVITAMILFGTETYSIPEGFSKPFTDEIVEIEPKVDKKPAVTAKKIVPGTWLEKYELLGLPMKPQNKDWLYLTWVTVDACGSDADFKLIQEVVGRLSGISKKDAKAAGDFPGSDEASG